MSLLDVTKDAIKSGRLFREPEQQFLAQKIALQWDEESFLKTANRRAA